MRLRLLHEANLFFYGTLMDHDKLEHVSGITKTGEKDTLCNYDKTQHDDYPNIVRKKGDKVDGVLVHATPAQLRKVDDWEEKYKRINVRLKSGKKAYAYRLNKH